MRWLFETYFFLKEPLSDGFSVVMSSSYGGWLTDSRGKCALDCKKVKIGAFYPIKLRAVCEKGLLLLTITIPEIEHILYPFLLKMIIPRSYTGATATGHKHNPKLYQL